MYSGKIAVPPGGGGKVNLITIMQKYHPLFEKCHIVFEEKLEM
jgi:hypothetical protein